MKEKKYRKDWKIFIFTDIIDYPSLISYQK